MVERTITEGWKQEIKGIGSCKCDQIRLSVGNGWFNIGAWLAMFNPGLTIEQLFSELCSDFFVKIFHFSDTECSFILSI